MADLPPYPGMPRWAKVVGSIIAILVLLLLIMVFIGGGDHGPGRHLPTGDAGLHAPPGEHEGRGR